MAHAVGTALHCTSSGCCCCCCCRHHPASHPARSGYHVASRQYCGRSEKAFGPSAMVGVYICGGNEEKVRSEIKEMNERKKEGPPTGQLIGRAWAPLHAPPFPSSLSFILAFIYDGKETQWEIHLRMNEWKGLA